MSRRLNAIHSFVAVSMTAIFAARLASAIDPAAPVDFNREVRPILANNCLICHGPDVHQRKAKLRLDVAEDATAPHKHGTPLVANDLGRSEAVRRILSADPDEKMPPPSSDKKLSAAQIDTLKRWVSQGAKYDKHWSFIAPRRPALPAVQHQGWSRNPIDRFVLARLEQEGLKPSPEADKATLCRRVSLDLLGLPPTPEQVDAFVADASPDAYEKLVDRLLANPHYGERMALDWLDAARYADTNGYHIDSGRDQTHWRDWVIDAFNHNKPFNEFTVEQLAGDLLPNATTAQKIATGFVRNNMINFEGGAVPEEYLNAYLVDRASTTATVWLGTTLGCCQCHDHKFDPFTQKDFYSFYAFFNAVPENGLDGSRGNAVPLLKTPSDEQQKQLDAIAASIERLRTQLAAPMPSVDAAQIEWEKTALDNHAKWIPLWPGEMKSKYGAKLMMAEDGSVVVSGLNAKNDTYTVKSKSTLKRITALRLEALPSMSVPGKIGRSHNGNTVLTDFLLALGENTDASQAKPIKFKLASADFSQTGFPVSAAIDDDPKSGWAIDPQIDKPHTAVFELAEPIDNATAQLLTVTLKFNSQYSEHQLSHFRLWATDSASPHGVDVMSAEVRSSLKLAAADRTPAQNAELRNFFRTNVCAETRKLADEIAHLRADDDAIDKQVPTTMVMADMPTPRDTFILMRGQYDKHGEKVSADVPQSLGALAADVPHNRLGLARWLVAPQQPLMSRVIVNRYWQSFFGTGLVKTVEDFGTQGEAPVNADLLDWLAVQFRDGDGGKARPWDVKALVRLIVTSATYRQAAVTTPELFARDPENRLLARGVRMRLSAEFIRDQALAISGLLNEEIGGKSVSPYQPAGLWEELMSRADGAKWTAQVYTQDHGKDLYRRTMYTFWKRTSPPPTLSTFDAPDRETCTVRRARTNTPLQALVLMNDPTYVEAARKLAERMMLEGGSSDEAKITVAFRLAVSRLPSAAEIAVLKRIKDHELAVFKSDPAAAQKLLTFGEAAANAKLDASELAAWSTVASVVLNLDETITKG